MPDNIEDSKLDTLKVSVAGIATKKVSEEVRKDIFEILSLLCDWVGISQDGIKFFVSEILNSDWWEPLEKANPESKWICIGHPEFWKFATWSFDSEWNPLVDEKWLYNSFSLLLKWGGNIVRLNWGQLRFMPKRKP
jgi:hypothetical protein